MTWKVAEQNVVFAWSELIVRIKLCLCQLFALLWIIQIKYHIILRFRHLLKITINTLFISY